jgi:hypothetical protein
MIAATDGPTIRRDTLRYPALRVLIVSGDDDLLSLRHHHGIPIVNSAQALQQIAR